MFPDSSKQDREAKHRLAWKVRARWIHYFVRYILENGYPFQVKRAGELLEKYNRGLLDLFDLWYYLGAVVEKTPRKVRVS